MVHIHMSVLTNTHTHEIEINLQNKKKKKRLDTLMCSCNQSTREMEIKSLKLIRPARLLRLMSFRFTQISLKN